METNKKGLNNREANFRFVYKNYYILHLFFLNNFRSWKVQISSYLDKWFKQVEDMIWNI